VRQYGIYQIIKIFKQFERSAQKVNVNKVYISMGYYLYSLDGRGITGYVNKIYNVSKTYLIKKEIKKSRTVMSGLPANKKSRRNHSRRP